MVGDAKGNDDGGRVEAVAAGATHAEGMRDEWCDEDYHIFSCPSLPPGGS